MEWPSHDGAPVGRDSSIMESGTFLRSFSVLVSYYLPSLLQVRPSAFQWAHRRHGSTYSQTPTRPVPAASRTRTSTASQRRRPRAPHHGSTASSRAAPPAPRAWMTVLRMLLPRVRRVLLADAAAPRRTRLSRSPRLRSRRARARTCACTRRSRRVPRPARRALPQVPVRVPVRAWVLALRRAQTPRCAMAKVGLSVMSEGITLVDSNKRYRKLLNLKNLMKLYGLMSSYLIIYAYFDKAVRPVNTGRARYPRFSEHLPRR